MPNVLLVHYTFPSVVGGVESVMARHARALRDAGVDVAIAAGRGRVGIRGVRAVRIPELDSRHPAVERTFRALAEGLVPDDLGPLAARIRKRLEPHVRRADRVVLHNVTTLHKNAALALALEALARGAARGKFVVWVHDVAVSDARYRAQLHAGDPWAVFARPLPGAAYVAVSEARRDEAAAALGLRRDEIVVVPNGVDEAEVLRLSASTRRLARRLRLGDGPLLLRPARLTRRKRVEVAIDAAAELARRGRSVRLVITGGPGPHNAANAAYLEELRARARAARGAAVLLHDAVGRTLPHRAVMELLAMSDVLVFPSEHEGFGIPLLEAATLRVPIVASDIPAHRALAGDDATYVEPDGDASALADAIAHVLDADPTARLRGVARAHAWDAIDGRVVSLVLGPARARRTA